MEKMYWAASMALSRKILVCKLAFGGEHFNLTRTPTTSSFFFAKIKGRFEFACNNHLVWNFGRRAPQQVACYKCCNRIVSSPTCELSVEKVENEALVEMGRARVVSTAVAWYASPIVPEPKEHASMRFWFDKHSLKFVVFANSYFVLEINKCAGFLCKETTFLTFDACSDYWQTKANRREVNRTVFFTYHSASKHTEMLFGLINAAATFQLASIVNFALKKLQLATMYRKGVEKVLAWDIFILAKRNSIEW